MSVGRSPPRLGWSSRIPGRWSAASRPAAWWSPPDPRCAARWSSGGRRVKERLDHPRTVLSSRRTECAATMVGEAWKCPHCGERILRSALTCPACRRHLRFDAVTTPRPSLRPTLCPLNVEGVIRHSGAAALSEYSVIVEVREEDRGEVI